MEIENIKQKRTANFTHSEESLLVQLCKKYKDILENKKSDVNITRKKNECWLEIEAQFNSKSTVTFRGAVVLKKKYENIKKRAKKSIADEKCYRKLTGGGPHKEFPVNSVDSDIIELIGQKRVEGLNATFGGDKEEAEYMEIIFEDNGNETTTADEINGEISNVMDDVSVTAHNNINIGNDQIHNWSRYAPDMLLTPQSKPLNTGKENNGTTRKKPENPITAKVSHWASVKANMEEYKKNQIEEEHKLKMDLMKEKHNVEIQLLKEESQVKQTSLKEESKIKLEILHMQKMQLFKNSNIPVTQLCNKY